jgi:hypothetical protein
MEKLSQLSGAEQEPSSLVERLSPLSILRRVLETRRHEQKLQKARKAISEVGYLATGPRTS